MTVTLILILATAAVFLLYVLTIALRAYARYRGQMVVTCPETHKPVTVSVDAPHAALTAAVDATDLRLTRCTRWPERQDCGQECVRQIELAPEDCMVRGILGKWYDGKSCALCGKAIEPIHAWTHRPGLITADNRVVGCTAVPPEQLPDTLAAAKPLCWSCEVTEEFRQQHGELVIDRPAFHTHAGEHGKGA